MITLRSKKTGKLIIASDNENVVKEYILGRFNKAFELFKTNGLFFPKTGIDSFDLALEDFQKGIDSYKSNAIIWQNVYKAFITVCPTSHIQKSTNKAETEDHIIEKII